MLPTSTFASFGRNRKWIGEPEVLLLILLVVGIYFTRLGSPTLRGEETRWGTCARLHLSTGDWIVPRQQGWVFAERPPLGNWLMAAGMLVFGQASPWAVRAPSVLAMLGTTLLVYGYARRFLTRGGSLAAAAALATMGEIMMLGRMGESESVFMFLVSSSLLLWHWGYSAKWSLLVTWCLGFALAGLAGLVKGPQGPVYFVAITGFFLLFMQRDVRSLLHPAYLAGWATLLLVVGLWQVPFLAATDGITTWRIWAGLVSDRVGTSPLLIRHLTTYPVEVLVATLPWSLFLPCFLYRGFWRQLDAARPYVVFLLTAAAIGFLPLWMAFGARTRYYMPLYPALAILAGVAIESCWRTSPRSFWQGTWRRIVYSMIVGMVVAGVGIFTISVTPRLQTISIAQGPGFATLYALACLLLATVLGRAWLREGTGISPLVRQRAGVLSMAAFLGLTTSGVVLNSLDRKANDIQGAVATLKNQLPPDARLVSFNRTHHVFAWHYERFIPAVPWPTHATDIPADLDYFCFENPGDSAPPLPFAWTPVAEVSCDRSIRARLHDKVVVGRRLPDSAATAHSPQSTPR